MSFFFGGFDKQRYSAHLRMVVERLRIAQNKRTNEVRAERRELAAMLAARKFDKARIKVESVLRKAREGEASEVLSLMVDLLIERVPLVAAEKTCPADLIECVSTVIWAAPRAGVEELKVVREQLISKYTEKWAAALTSGPESRVNGKVLTRLTVRARAQGVGEAPALLAGCAPAARCLATSYHPPLPSPLQSTILLCAE